MIRRRRYMARLFFGWIYVLLFGQQVMAERMVTDLSRHVIEITSKFSGTELLIFGAIERNIPQKEGGHGIVIEGTDYDIIVVVQSARRDMVIRRKEQIGPVWANRESLTLKNIQGFYALTSTRAIDQILSHKELVRRGIGLKQLKVEFEEPASAGEAAGFRAGFIRNMKEKKLYNQQEGTISILDGILFRAILEFPANMPVGDYQVDVYLIRDGEILLAEQSPLEVGKTGLERFIFRFANIFPASYGIIAVLVALLAGWLGGFMSRKMGS